MKVIATVYVKLECEGIDVEKRLKIISKQISKLHAKLEKAWEEYSNSPTEETSNKIEMLRECLHDYEEEFNYLLGE